MSLCTHPPFFYLLAAWGTGPICLPQGRSIPSATPSGPTVATHRIRRHFCTGTRVPWTHGGKSWVKCRVGETDIFSQMFARQPSSKFAPRFPLRLSAFHTCTALGRPCGGKIQGGKGEESSASGPSNVQAAVLLGVREFSFTTGVFEQPAGLLSADHMEGGSKLARREDTPTPRSRS